MEDREWLMLNFTLPKEPSRVRVSVWRKLKKCGSVNIGQSMWLLPLSEEHVAFYNEISKDILFNGGEAYILRTTFIHGSSSDSIIEVFNKAREEEYKELLEKCENFFSEIEKETAKNNFSFIEVEENEYEYSKMTDWYKKISERDFFNAPYKVKLEQELYKCKELLADFSEKVYQLNTQD